MAAVALLLGLLPATVAAEVQLGVLPPVVSSTDPNLESRLHEILGRAVFALNLRDRGEYHASLVVEHTSYDFILKSVATGDSKSRTLVLTLTRPGDKSFEESFPFLSPWTEDFGKEVAQAIEYLLAEANGLPTAAPDSAPVYVDTLTPRMLSGADLPYPVQLRSYSVTVVPAGRIVVGTALAAVELDSLYREIGKPGRSLLDGGESSYAYQVYSTRAGTIVSRPSSGGELYVIHGHSTQRIRTGIDQPSAIAVLDDGSIVVADSLNRRALRFTGNSSQNFPIYPYDSLYISAIGPGPDDTLWVWDPVEGRLRIYSADGQQVDSIIPQIARTKRGSVKAIEALRDGSFILLGQNFLARFDRHGVPMWTLDTIPNEEHSGLTFVNSMAYDATNGFIYLVNISSGEIVRLLDPHPPAGFTPPSELTRRVVALNRNLGNQTQRAAIFREKAQLYEERNAFELAEEQWQHLLDLRPGDAEARRQSNETEARILHDRARRAAERTFSLLKQFGTETARVSYQAAVKLYEQVLSRTPGDSRVRAELEQLKRTFAGGGPAGGSPESIQIARIELHPLFPALLGTYRREPIGAVLVRNTGAAPVANIQVSTAMRYLDFPKESPVVARLAAGAEISIPLFAPISSDALKLEEDLPVQVGVTVSYDGTAGGSSERFSSTRSFETTLYRNTALTWDDTRKFSAFITPADNLVSTFALDLAHDAPPAGAAERMISGLPAKMGRAVKIIDGLGAYGLTYIEDPSAPFEAVFDNAKAVDTVRFPRTTLRVHSGDCDDTTALLASLLEAAAIQTAIMTSPGHVFLAFDTGEPTQNRWMFDIAGYLALPYTGTLWIPIETTVLSEGFAEAWRSASTLVAHYKGTKEIEFIPTASAQSRFPPIPLTAASFEVLPPAPERVAAYLEGSASALHSTLVRGAEEELAQRGAAGGGEGSDRSALRLGVLEARYGRFDAAAKLFADLIERSPSSLPAYLNLANVQLLRKDPGAAEATLKRAERRMPGSPSVLFLLAEAARNRSDHDAAEEYLARLEKLAPDLAARLRGPLGASSGEVGRASSAARAFTPLWSDGE